MRFLTPKQPLYSPHITTSLRHNTFNLLTQTLTHTSRKTSKKATMNNRTNSQFGFAKDLDLSADVQRTIAYHEGYGQRVRYCLFSIPLLHY